MGEEQRQHPRFRVAMPVHLALPGAVVHTTTVGVSRGGVSVRVQRAVPSDVDLAITLELPSGTSIDGRARVRVQLPDGLCGMSLEMSADAQAHWDAFIDEEEQTGGLWRMIGRIARAPDDDNAPRGVSARIDADDVRLHTVGENGEAYRVAFERHPADAPADSDLSTLPGFAAVTPQLSRVLREPMSLRVDDDGKVVVARVVELARGGYAYVTGSADAAPDDAVARRETMAVVALCQGELVVVQKNGHPVFPFFSHADLERIACDTFRADLSRPVFSKPPHTPSRGTARPAPVKLPPVAPGLPSRFKEGLDAIRFAQAAAEDVQVRRYGDRELWFHPSVWARVVEGAQVWMGPTLQDGDRVCVLALVGPGAPRVVRVDDGTAVTVMKPPR